MRQVRSVESEINVEFTEHLSAVQGWKLCLPESVEREFVVVIKSKP